MPPPALDLKLTSEDQPDNYSLSSMVANYKFQLRRGPETKLGNLLRRLPAVLVGDNDPEGVLSPQALLRETGIHLRAALLPDTAPADQRDALASQLRATGTALRLALPSALAELPWELLHDPDLPENMGFLAQRRPLIRLLAGGQSLEPPDPPLRVLLLISSPPTVEEARRVDVESEREAVEEALRGFREAGMLHLLVEDIVSVRRVHQHLIRFRPHILHYIGHGGYSTEDGGFLEWEQDSGEPLLLSGAQLAMLLQPRNLYAVLLHGCETAQSDARSEFSGVSEALLNAGIPAVFAQQAGFTYASSKRASETFYMTLTSGLGLGEAAFEARLALAQEGRPDWAVPTLQARETGLAPLLAGSILPGERDPLLEPALIASDLPAPTGPFVGRHPELRALRLMLEAPSGSEQVLGLVLGPGGIGKSTLAAQAVTRYGRGYKAALTLRCAGYQNFGLFLQRVAEFMDSQGSSDLLNTSLPDPRLSTMEKIRRAIAALNSAGPFLLVVDNLESVQDEQGNVTDPELLFFLQELMMGLRRGRVLITGRYAVSNLLAQGKFQGSMLRLDLDDLSRYEVFQLLNRHPALARLGEEVQKELVNQFGGLPYVYDLLASEAAAQNLNGLISDMQGRVTEERQQRSADEWTRVRRRVVEFAALDSAVARLQTRSYELLEQLSVFSRPFPQEALEQGLGAAPSDWQPLLDWSLLRYNQQEGEYRLHSLTASYMRERVDATTWKETQLRLAAWYVQHIDDSHDLTDALEAHRLYLEAGAAEEAGELANSLATLLQRFGLYGLGRNLAQTTAKTTTGSTAAWATLQQGSIALRQGDYDGAKRLYAEARDIFFRLGEDAGRAATLGGLGTIASEQGDYDEAKRLYAESLAIQERLGDQSGRAGTLGNLGNIALRQGDYDEAKRLYAESLAIQERLGDQSERARTLANLGTIALEQGDYDEAKRLLAEARDIFFRLGEDAGRAATLGGLGTIASEQGDYDEAKRLYAESLAIRERLGDQSGRARTLGNLGNIALEQGGYDEAKRLYAESLAIQERLGDQSGRASTLANLGTVALEQGDYRGALHYAIQALYIFRGLQSPYQQRVLMSINQLRSQVGEEEFAALWREVAQDSSLPDQPDLSPSSPALDEDLAHQLIALLQADTWGETRQMVQDQPQLISEEADHVLVQLVAMQESQEWRQIIELHRQLLARCREIGVEAAFAEFLAALEQEQQAPAEQSPTEAVDVLRKLVQGVYDLLKEGTLEQRMEAAEQLDADKAKIPDDGVDLGNFLGCLADALRGEKPDVSVLKEPFSSLWQALQQALDLPPVARSNETEGETAGTREQEE